MNRTAPLNIWSILLASFVMLNLAYVGAIARDGASMSGQTREKR